MPASITDTVGDTVPAMELQRDRSEEPRLMVFSYIEKKKL